MNENQQGALFLKYLIVLQKLLYKERRKTCMPRHRRKKRKDISIVTMICMWPIYLLLIPFTSVFVIPKIAFHGLIGEASKENNRRRVRKRYHRNKW